MKLYICTVEFDGGQVHDIFFLRNSPPSPSECGDRFRQVAISLKETEHYKLWDIAAAEVEELVERGQFPQVGHWTTSHDNVPIVISFTVCGNVESDVMFKKRIIC